MEQNELPKQIDRLFFTAIIALVLVIVMGIIWISVQ